MVTQKRYIKIKQNLEFILSDIADTLDGKLNESAFKSIDRFEIDYCLNEEVKKGYNPHYKTPFIAFVEYLNRHNVLIWGVSKEAVVRYCYQTDKFNSYKF